MTDVENLSWREHCCAKFYMLVADRDVKYLRDSGLWALYDNSVLRFPTVHMKFCPFCGSELPKGKEDAD